MSLVVRKPVYQFILTPGHFWVSDEVDTNRAVQSLPEISYYQCRESIGADQS